MSERSPSVSRGLNVTMKTRNAWTTSEPPVDSHVTTSHMMNTMAGWTLTTSKTASKRTASKTAESKTAVETVTVTRSRSRGAATDVVSVGLEKRCAGLSGA